MNDGEGAHGTSSTSYPTQQTYMIGSHTPWHDPNAGSSQWSIADTMGPQTQQTYATQYDEADFETDGTDTDTSSDDGEKIPIDFTSWIHMPAEEAGQEIYWMYKTAKKAWRRFSNKPVRKARRFAKRLSLIHI